MWYEQNQPRQTARMNGLHNWIICCNGASDVFVGPKDERIYVDVMDIKEV